MNIPTLIGSIVLLVIVGLIIWKMIRDKKNGKGGCGGNCESCGGCGDTCSCSSKDDPNS